jgi:membrane protease YdiL (CAAX protease family)
MVINERNGRLSNFLSPAVAATMGLLLLGLGAYSLVALDYIVPLLPPDNVIATIIANLAGQIVVILAVFFLVIPLLRVKVVEYRRLTFFRTLKSVPVFCLVYTVAMGVAMALTILFDSLGFPVVSSYGAILLTPTQLANPLNLAIFFATTTIGAAVSEELLFRRTIIPSLEARGMAPLAAVFASSLGFSVVHMPNDLINGSPAFVVSHFATTFVIGILLAVSYVTTRNVLFPMILHGLINLVSFGADIVETLGAFDLILAYGFLVLAIWLVGFVVGLVVLFQFMKTPPAAWTNVLRIRSKIDLLPGLSGYIVVAVLLVTLQVLGELALVVLLVPDIGLILDAVCGFYLILFVLLVLLLRQTRYEGSNAAKPELSAT